MRTYETTFIISGAVSETNREAIIARYEKQLTDNGAEFKRIARWGKRQLAYPINKQSRGYYVIYYYDADPAIINPMHREMDLNEQILRYMTLISDGIHPDYVRDEGTPDESTTTASTPVVEKVASDDTVASETTEETASDETVETVEAAAEESAPETTDESDDTASEKPAEEAAADDDEKEVE